MTLWCAFTLLDTFYSELILSVTLYTVSSVRTFDMRHQGLYSVIKLCHEILWWHLALRSQWGSATCVLGSRQFGGTLTCCKSCRGIVVWSTSSHIAWRLSRKVGRMVPQSPIDAERGLWFWVQDHCASPKKYSHLITHEGLHKKLTCFETKMSWGPKVVIFVAHRLPVT